MNEAGCYFSEATTLHEGGLKTQDALLNLKEFLLEDAFWEAVHNITGPHGQK